MSRTCGMLILFLLLRSKHPHAQEGGDPRAGLALAREICASCHAILEGETNSPDQQAPSFERIAAVPSMTPMALTVALQTSHETMPNCGL